MCTNVEGSHVARDTKFRGKLYVTQCCGSGRLLSLSGSGSDFSNELGQDPKPCTNFSQQEIFGPKVAFKSYLRGKKLLYHTCIHNVSILAASDPDPVPNVRLRIRNTDVTTALFAERQKQK
jgi:hypothetical protein